MRSFAGVVLEESHGAVRTMQREQARQLGDRVPVIVDPQVDMRFVRVPAEWSIRCDDDRRALLAAGITS